MKLKQANREVSHIRISRKLAYQMKVFAATNKKTMVETANLIIQTGMGLLKK